MNITQLFGYFRTVKPPGASMDIPWPQRIENLAIPTRKYDQIPLKLLHEGISSDSSSFDEVSQSVLKFGRFFSQTTWIDVPGTSLGRAWHFPVEILTPNRSEIPKI